jgi:hypothetical protein
MLLVCTPRGSIDDSSQDWLAVGLQLQAQGWPLQSLQVLPQGTKLDAVNAAKVVADAAGGSEPVERVQARYAVDTEGQWAHLQGVCGSAAVLVRPDGHVAWRSRDGSGTDSISSSTQAAAGNIAGGSRKQDMLQHVLRDVLCLKRQQC